MKGDFPMTITTTPDVEDLDALAARMAALADEVTWHVHQRDPDTIADLVVPLSVLELRTLAAAVGLAPSRVHQFVAGAGLGAVIGAVGELRAAGWPAPKTPGSDQDTDLDGRDHLAGRLPDEVDWLRQCAGWLSQPRPGAGAWSVPARPISDGGIAHDRNIPPVDDSRGERFRWRPATEAT